MHVYTLSGYCSSNREQVCKIINVCSYQICFSLNNGVGVMGKSLCFRDVDSLKTGLYVAEKVLVSILLISNQNTL